MSPSGSKPGLVARIKADLRIFPRHFWVLMAGTALLNLAIAIGMPYETIYVTEQLGVSATAVGVVWTASALIGLPMLLLGGMVADWRGRRLVLGCGAATIVLFYTVMALSHALWQVAVVAVLDGAFGWPLFLIACNAMIADLVPVERRNEAYSIWRAAINAGVVFGPLIAGLLIAGGASYRVLFAGAALGCAVVVLAIVLFVGETRPPQALRTEEGDQVPLLRGMATVLRTRRFVLFSLVSLLVLFCFGQFLWIFPIYLTTTLAMAPGSWGLLLALSGTIIVVFSAPVARLSGRFDNMLLMSLSSALIALGLGLAAFVPGGWPIIPLVAVFSFGEVLLWPVSSTAVSEMAPVALRGTFMGAWTLVDCLGRGIGPLAGGWALDAIGGRQNFALVLVVGLAGAGLFPLLRRREQPRPRQPSQA